MAFGKGKKSGGKSAAFGKGHMGKGKAGGSSTGGKSGILTTSNVKAMGSK